MGVERVLVTLYPKKWRDSFGDEFTALLEETPITPVVVWDVAIHAGRLRVQSHRKATIMVLLLAWSACLDYISVHAGLTANILWAPTKPERALALVATIGPWIALPVVSVIRHHTGDHGTKVHSPAS
jgi:hypothetical protein